MSYAFDKSARTIDADGRLHVARTRISKAAVNPYYGREIPGYDALGLDPDRMYKLLRDPDELAKGAESFARLPVMSKHVPITVERIADDPELKQLIVGAIGSSVEFSNPYLYADICVWDAPAIAGIESEQVCELSCSYRYVPVMEPGEYQGQPYDGRMTDIRGNHLALVEVGRAGPDVFVADANPFPRTPAMKMTKLGKALFAALCAASPVLAADSALPALVGQANRKTINKADLSAKLLALDANLDPTQVGSLMDALTDVSADPEPVTSPTAVADASPVDKLRQLLAGKVDDATIEAACALIPAAPAAVDADPDEDKGMKKDEVNAAMDAMSTKLRAEMREAMEAARDVRNVVGDVAMDSAAEIYGFALDHLKVDRAGVEGVPALRALFRAASAKAAAVPAVAHDSADAFKRFPAASRFRNA
jgi:hypothetical protein